MIDTPGMRELQLESGSLAEAFGDIEGLAAGCRYKDCSHAHEPGCEVRRAIQEGRLSAGRLENFDKIRKEIGYEGLNSRQLEQEKINRMFGSKGAMKQLMTAARDKYRRR